MVSRVHGRKRGRKRGRGVRGSVLVGLLCTLALAGLGYTAWELRGIAANRADGDPARGTYQQDPERADKTAAAVLDGIVREAAEPPTDGKAFTDGGKPGELADHAAGSPPIRWRPGPPPPSPRSARSSPPAPTATPTTTARPSWSTPPAATSSRPPPTARTAAGSAPTSPSPPATGTAWPRTASGCPPGSTSTRAGPGTRTPTTTSPSSGCGKPGYPGQRLEDVTGAETIAFRPQLPAPARLVGYPNHSEQPLECRNTAVAAGPTQLRLDCADVPNGTSGGPVLTDGRTLIGVIGGRDGGGDDRTSYSIYFGDDTKILYERSTAP